jgi:hypothetical protein
MGFSGVSMSQQTQLSPDKLPVSRQFFHHVSAFVFIVGFQVQMRPISLHPHQTLMINLQGFFHTQSLQRQRMFPQGLNDSVVVNEFGSIDGQVTQIGTEERDAPEMVVT